MMLSTRRPERAVIYGLLMTLGSVAGSYVVYGITRGGGKFIWRKSTPAALTRAQRWLDRYDFVALMACSLLPPPAPYKVFVLTAGLLRMNAARFGAALLVGRGLRFITEALLAARYGPVAQTYIQENMVTASLAAVGVVLAAALAYRWLTSRSLKRVPGGPS